MKVFNIIMFLIVFSSVKGQCFIDENGIQHCNNKPQCIIHPDGTESCVV